MKRLIRKAMLCTLTLGLLTVGSTFVSLADVKTLDELTAETTASATVQSTEAVTKAETEAQTKESVESGLKSGAGSGYSFADTLMGMTDMSEGLAQSAEASRSLKLFCTIILQVLASFGIGFYVVCVAMDAVFIIITPLQGLLVPGLPQTLTQLAQQGGGQQGGAPGMGGPMGGSPMGMGMGMNGMGGGYGMAGGRFGGGGYGNQMMQGQGQQQGNMQSRQVMGVSLISPCAIASLVQSIQSGTTPIVDYGKKAGKTAIFSAVLFVLASTGVLAKVGIVIGVKVSQLINNGLAKAV